MKVVILAGGYGTRISEESAVRPKPLVEIGGMPILWHIMKIYSAHGLNDFVICCGYKGDMIKEYFANYFLRASDVTFDLRANRTRRSEQRRAVDGDAGRHRRRDDDRRAHQAGARVRRRRDLLPDLRRRRQRHRHRRRSSPSTASRARWRRSPPCSRPAASARSRSARTRPRFDLQGEAGRRRRLDQRRLLRARARGDRLHRRRRHGLGAGAARALAPRASSPSTHRGYWQNMDTLRDKIVLESHWESGRPPWKIW